MPENSKNSETKNGSKQAAIKALHFFLCQSDNKNDKAHSAVALQLVKAPILVLSDDCKTVSFLLHIEIDKENFCNCIVLKKCYQFTKMYFASEHRALP